MPNGVLQGITGKKERIPFLSTVTGRPIAGTDMDPHYWWRNVRETVRFDAAIVSAINAGHQLYLEIGPHPALAGAIDSCLVQSGRKGFSFPSLRRGQDEKTEMLRNFASFSLRGGKVDWKQLYPDAGATARLRFPSYPWQRKRYWMERPIDRRDRLTSHCHPLLGHRRDTPNPSWEVWLDPHVLDYLDDHKFWDRIVFPVSGFTEIALAVARELFPNEKWVVEQLEVERILFVSTEQIPKLRIECDPDNDHRVTIHSQSGETEAWTRHAECRIAPALTGPQEDFDLKEARKQLNGHSAHWDFYEEFAELGYPYGETFRAIEQVWFEPQESLAEVVVPDRIVDQLGDYHFHPAVLDACTQAFLGGLKELRKAVYWQERSDRFYLPGGIGSLHFFTDELPSRFWVHTRILKVEEGYVLGELRVYDRKGKHLASVNEFRLDESPRYIADANAEGYYYELEWEDCPVVPRENSESETEAQPQLEETILIVAPSSDFTDQIVESIANQFARVEQLALDEVGESKEALAEKLSSIPFPEKASLTIIHLGCLFSPNEESLGLDGLRKIQSNGVLSGLTLMRALPVALDLDRVETRLIFLSRNNRGPEEVLVPSLAASSLRGMMRVGLGEHPEIKSQLVVLEETAPSREIESLLTELESRDNESEILWKDGIRYGRRLRRASLENMPRRARKVSSSKDLHYRLETDRPGELGRLSFHEFTPSKLAPDEVEVSINSAASPGYIPSAFMRSRKFNPTDPMRSKFR
ncbi:MAG: polyketide synthase dehydratase domain-containing protein, partial [Verrucomicrobiota bacterium]